MNRKPFSSLIQNSINSTTGKGNPFSSDHYQHCFGTILNNILTSAVDIQNTTTYSKVDRLTKLNRLLDHHSGNCGDLDDSTREEILKKYLGFLERSLAEENRRIRENIKDMLEAINELRSLFSSQLDKL